MYEMEPGEAFLFDGLSKDMQSDLRQGGHSAFGFGLGIAGLVASNAFEWIAFWPPVLFGVAAAAAAISLFFCYWSWRFPGEPVPLWYIGRRNVTIVMACLPGLVLALIALPAYAYASLATHGFVTNLLWLGLSIGAVWMSGGTGIICARHNVEARYGLNSWIG